MTAPRPGRNGTILVIDDDRNLRTVLRATFELAGFGVVAAPDGAAALAELDTFTPDLIVLDVVLPEMDGYEVLRRIRRHGTASHVPIVILTGHGEVEDAIATLESGADDYLAKPFSPQELLARVRAKLRRAQFDASVQPLTRLPGNIAIEAEVKRRFEGRIPWAVVYADLDNFKAFNDAYGFARGDDAIRALAAAIAEGVRIAGSADDFVGHIGGDDFIIVSTPQRAEAVARAVAEAFDRVVGGLYDPEDRARGEIVTRDRRGTVQHYPLMSVSLAVVPQAPRITTYQQIGEVAAELKHYAKRHSGSYVAVDQRRDD